MKRLKNATVAMLGLALTAMVVSACQPKQNNSEPSKESATPSESVIPSEEPTSSNPQESSEAKPSSEASSNSSVQPSSEAAVVVTSIAIEQNPTKTEYVVGQTFDPTGMKVVANYSDGTKKVITDYTIDKTGPLSLGDKNITISYQGFKTTVAITVVDVAAIGIEVTTNPNKLNYKVGEAFDPTGMVISLVKNNGEKEAVTGYTIDVGNRELSLADDHVVITYQEFSANLSIVVSEASLERIEITTEPTKVNYFVGEVFDPAGMVVTAFFDNGKNEVVTNYTYSRDPLTLEQTAVVISYGGKTASITIHVEQKYDLDINNVGTFRMEAENLDFSKATLREDFIQAGRTFVERPYEPYGSLTSGGASICGYNPGSIFEIVLKVEADARIHISSIMSDTNTDYDLKDGLKFEVDDQTLDPSPVQFTWANQGGNYWEWKDVHIGNINLTAGIHTFRITSINQRPNIDCFDFTVFQYGDIPFTKEATGISIASLPTKLTYEAGEHLDLTGLTLEVKYNDFTSEIVSEGFTADKDVLVASDHTITVTFASFTAQFEITVGEAVDFVVDNYQNIRLEAENMDYSNITLQDGFSAPNVENSSIASNGKGVGGVISGYFEYKVRLNVPAYLEIISSICKYEDHISTNKISMTVDGVEYTHEAITLGHTDAHVWDNYKQFPTVIGALETGVHTIRINLLDGCNLDYFELQFKDPNAVNVDFVVNDYQSVKLEAEALDFANLVNTDGVAYIENNGLSSGGASVGHVDHGYFDITFKTTLETKLVVKGMFSKYEAVSLSEYVEFKLDNETVSYTDITLGRATDGSNDWFNWKEAATNETLLEEGTHVLRINFVKGCNFDCVTLEFMPNIPSNGAALISNQEVKFEAENATPTAWKNSGWGSNATFVATDAEANASGGAFVTPSTGTYDANRKFEIVIYAPTDGEITMKVAYCRGGKNTKTATIDYSYVYQYRLDGETGKFTCVTENHTDSSVASWHWRLIEFKVNVTKGFHTIAGCLDKDNANSQAGCPCIDYYLFAI